MKAALNDVFLASLTLIAGSVGAGFMLLILSGLLAGAV
jgi:hypothetical protein